MSEHLNLPTNTPQKTPSFLKRGAEVPIDCRVHVEQFEGPLDLLLFLIKNNELDIKNLQVAAITRQYLNYLDYMRELNLDLASEYLVMAATLTFLKSQVILPQEQQVEAMGPDPRAQLIRRLIELKCYKEIADHLSSRPWLYREVFPCRNTGAEEIEAGIEPEVELSNPFQLVEAYKDLITRRKVVVHNVYEDEVPIASCVADIAQRLKVQDTITFQQLLPQVYKTNHMVSMFLGVLEMAKMQLTTIDQEEIFGPIVVKRRVSAEEMDKAHLMSQGLSWE